MERFTEKATDLGNDYISPRSDFLYVGPLLRKLRFDSASSCTNLQQSITRQYVIVLNKCRKLKIATECPMT